MQFSRPNAELFVPDGTPADDALKRTTHLAVGAHPDDLEVMAFHGIAGCFKHPDRWFGGVVVSDGAGAPRSGPYASLDATALRQVRASEQKKAATIGEYAFQVLLAHTSSTVKDAAETAIVDELEALLRKSRPRRVYTHNLADKHDTHVAVTLRLISACRRLEPELRPRQVWGCEVWRNLDWLDDSAKIVMDCSGPPSLASTLIGVFDSQIASGKRYDLATPARWLANATFFQSHDLDEIPSVSYAMDLTPLIHDPNASVTDFIGRHLDHLRNQVTTSLRNMDGESRSATS